MNNELLQLQQVTQSNIDKQAAEIKSQEEHLKTYVEWINKKRIFFAENWDRVKAHIRRVGFEIDTLNFTSHYYQYKQNSGSELVDYTTRRMQAELRCKCVGKYKSVPKSYGYNKTLGTKAEKIEDRLNIFEDIRISVNQYSFEYDAGKGETEESKRILITVGF